MSMNEDNFNIESKKSKKATLKRKSLVGLFLSNIWKIWEKTQKSCLNMKAFSDIHFKSIYVSILCLGFIGKLKMNLINVNLLEDLLKNLQRKEAKKKKKKVKRA